MRQPASNRIFVIALAIALLLSSAVALAGERGYFGFSPAVSGKGFFLNPTVTRIAIDKVAPGTPAARGGLRAGDEIVKIEGVAVAGQKGKALQAAATREVGQTLNLELKRPNGERYTVALVAVSRPKDSRPGR